MINNFIKINKLIQIISNNNNAIRNLYKKY